MRLFFRGMVVCCVIGLFAVSSGANAKPQPDNDRQTNRLITWQFAPRHLDSYVENISGDHIKGILTEFEKIQGRVVQEDGAITDEKQEELIELSVANTIEHHINVAFVKGQIKRFYGHHFSHDELENLVNFLKTPVGRLYTVIVNLVVAPDAVTANERRAVLGKDHKDIIAQANSDILVFSKALQNRLPHGQRVEYLDFLRSPEGGRYVASTSVMMQFIDKMIKKKIEQLDFEEELKLSSRRIITKKGRTYFGLTEENLQEIGVSKQQIKTNAKSEEPDEDWLNLTDDLPVIEDMIK